MNEPYENRLGAAASAYLRSARHQPVAWHEWGDEAFARAAREGKPVLLDIGAVWCHWCHVMDRESYENAVTAALINEHFVAVKVDRDERPDVDTRYQAAVQAISGQGGWPLTAFLTPDGKPFFGGTYFPPEERYGRPSFARVLLTMSEAFVDRREEVEESAGSVMAAIEHGETFTDAGGELGQELSGKLVASVLSQFDERHGGFGAQPKFPHSGAIDLLIDHASRGNNGAARKAARVTLAKMADGGIHDQLAGGFHRYSVDERWVVPHFEKMAYDNSELLKNYVHAFQTFGDVAFAAVAKGIMRWMDAVLSDRKRGGFYASQDADASLDDDGDYFTWTLAEARAVLSLQELAVASAFFNIGDVGDMHHNPAKNVLHIAAPLDAVAQSCGCSVDAAAELLESAKAKLYAARSERPAPFVDRTIYTGWNAMCISAYLLAGRVLRDEEARDFALRSLDRVLEARRGNDGLPHVVAYGAGVASAFRVPGVLEDYALLGLACLDAWEATGELRFYSSARELTDAMIGRFYDTDAHGFFDTETLPGAEAPFGALRARRKPVQDAPVPAGNSVAAMLLLRMDALAEQPDYGDKARSTLKFFAGIVEHFGLYAATYGLALVRAVHGTVQVCIVGDDHLAVELASAALARYAANKSVVRLRSRQTEALPPSPAATLPELPTMGGSYALVCRGQVCLPPVETVDGLIDALI